MLSRNVKLRLNVASKRSSPAPWHRGISRRVRDGVFCLLATIGLILVTTFTSGCDDDPDAESAACDTTLLRFDWLIRQLPVDHCEERNQLLFLSRESTNGPAGLYLVDAGRAGEVSLVVPLEIYELEQSDARFSPDGRQLAYVRGNPRALFTMDLLSEEERQLTSGVLLPGNPTFDRNSSRILYIRKTGPDVGLVMIALASGMESPIRGLDDEPLFLFDMRWGGSDRYLACRNSIGDAAIVLDLETKIEVFRHYHPESIFYTLGWVAGTTRCRFQEVSRSCVAASRTFEVESPGARVSAVPNVRARPLPIALSEDGERVFYVDADSTRAYGAIYVRDVDDTDGTDRIRLTRYLP